MRALALLASVGVHVLVAATSPRGQVLPGRSDQETPDPTPVELLDARDLVRPPVIEPERPPPEPPPPEPPPPEPPPPEPPPKAAPPEPPPPKPASPPPRARPRASVAPPAIPGSDSVPASDAEPTPGSPGEGDGSPTEPRRLDMTLSNRGDGGTPAAGDSRKPRPAPPKCKQPITKPRPKTKIPVRYTRAARAAGLHGRLILRASVDAKGAVTDVEVLRSVGPLVDEPAATALRGWTFTPATRCGRPVAGRFTIARDFTLAD